MVNIEGERESKGGWRRDQRGGAHVVLQEEGAGPFIGAEGRLGGYSKAVAHNKPVIYSKAV